MQRFSFPLTKSTILASVCILFLCSGMVGAQSIKTPEAHFGFKPGADGLLLDYDQLIAYLEHLDDHSPRLTLLEIGRSPMGRSMVACFISSPMNIQNLSRLKEINRRLALDPAIPDEERRHLVEEGKVFVCVTLSMHSTEVGPSQASSLIAHDLVTTEDPEMLRRMDDVVYMMVPNSNPDGMQMIVEDYRKKKGTPYEGSSMPGVYHKYLGHDNNRDYVTLSQSDTRAVASLYNTEWFPHVLVDKHQMGSTGPRYFVPPVHDPISENVDAELWNWTGIFGTNMIKDMTKEGLSGVSQHYAFDEYWPGCTETCLWNNVIGMLTECASARLASPIFIEFNELQVRGKGLSEYKKSINMPLPWPGGWWKLSDIVQYEIVSTMSALKTAAFHHKDILRFKNDLCRREVEKGKTLAPFYFVFPQHQTDPGALIDLLRLLQSHGIDVYRLSRSLKSDESVIREGNFVVPLAQPFRALAKEILEKQKYPLRHYTPDGEIIRPYDITSWSLPYHRGVQVVQVDERMPDMESALVLIEDEPTFFTGLPEPFDTVILNTEHNQSFRIVFQALNAGIGVKRLNESVLLNGEKIPKGSFVVTPDARNEKAWKEITGTMTVQPTLLKGSLEAAAVTLRLPRVVLVETPYHDMDAGWTRYVFDTYNIPFHVLRPYEIEKVDLEKVDVVVFPDASKDVLMDGKVKRDEQTLIPDYPPEVVKGMGKKGMANLMTFIDRGGLIVSWGGSAALFSGKLEIQRGKKGNKETEEFQLPIRDITKALQKTGLFCPGSLLEARFLQDHPLTLGVPEKIGVFFRRGPVFQTSIPRSGFDRRVIAAFPEEEILISGYIEKGKELGNKPAMVWLRKGKGQFVLFAFHPQYRASTQASYKLLFNAVLMESHAE